MALVAPVMLWILVLVTGLAVISGRGNRTKRESIRIRLLNEIFAGRTLHVISLCLRDLFFDQIFICLGLIGLDLFVTATWKWAKKGCFVCLQMTPHPKQIIKLGAAWPFIFVCMVYSGGAEEERQWPLSLTSIVQISLMSVSLSVSVCLSADPPYMYPPLRILHVMIPLQNLPSLLLVEPTTPRERGYTSICMDRP